jgi:hypothetical protein
MTSKSTIILAIAHGPAGSIASIDRTVDVDIRFLVYKIATHPMNFPQKRWKRDFGNILYAFGIAECNGAEIS